VSKIAMTEGVVEYKCAMQVLLYLSVNLTFNSSHFSGNLTLAEELYVM